MNGEDLVGKKCYISDFFDDIRNNDGIIMRIVNYDPTYEFPFQIENGTWWRYARLAEIDIWSS